MRSYSPKYYWCLTISRDNAKLLKDNCFDFRYDFEKKEATFKSKAVRDKAAKFLEAKP